MSGAFALWGNRMANHPTQTNASAADKLEALFNEQKLRNAERRSKDASTMHERAQAEADDVRGRFAQIEKSSVVGSKPTPEYPAGPAWTHDPTGIEPCLGFDINEVPIVGEPHEIQRSLELGPAAPPIAGRPGRRVESIPSRSLTSPTSLAGANERSIVGPVSDDDVAPAPASNKLKTQPRGQR
jgi:hypothetical protein